MTPKALVFDVNETLLDLEHMTPLFERLFGSGVFMREWFAQTILYSQTVTLGGAYAPLGAIGAGTLKAMGAIHGIAIAEADVAEMRDRLVSLPAHPDVVAGLTRLADAGFRLATLTNSPPQPDGGPMRKAGIDHFFEARLSVDEVRGFKPARATYAAAADRLGIALAEICLVACHVWDTLGAQLHGASGALLLRSGNAPVPIDGLPAPTLIAADMHDLVGQAVARWR